MDFAPPFMKQEGYLFVPHPFLNISPPFVHGTLHSSNLINSSKFQKFELKYLCYLLKFFFTRFFFVVSLFHSARYMYIFEFEREVLTIHNFLYTLIRSIPNLLRLILRFNEFSNVNLGLRFQNM